MRRYFCTYFDRNYLPRGLALYQSLLCHCPDFQLWALCMDRVSHDTLTALGLPRVHAIALDDFEKGDDALVAVKQHRTPIEFYFTCSPSLPLFVLNHYPYVDLITYLDADLFFFSDPTPIYREFGNRSIAIIGHRFAPTILGAEHDVGTYNVGWVSFRRDADALSCLRWWRDRCLEWCYDRCENGRFADQKYLDDWPTRFRGVAVLQHKGANLAPWNLANYTIRTQGSRLLVDDQCLIFFHFHGFKQIERWVYDPHLALYQTRASTVVRRSIYAPYIRTLAEVARSVPYSAQDTDLLKSIRQPGAVTGSNDGVAQRLKRSLRLLRSVLQNDYLFAPNGRVW